MLVLPVLLVCWGCAGARLANTSAAESRSGTASGRVAANTVPASGRDEIVFLGRCVDDGSHAPIAGVDAVVHRDVGQRDVCDNELLDDPAAAQAVSGEDGIFRLVCQRVTGAEYSVRIGNRDHVHRTRRFGPYERAREIDLGDVALQHGVQVRLTVVDRRGEPVGGIRVGASDRDYPRRHDMLMVDPDFPWRSDPYGVIEPPGAMRRGGAYTLVWYSAGLPSDRSLGALHVPADRDRFDAVLVWPVEDARHAIRGRVVEVEGEPVPNVNLGGEGGGTRGNARTRADGTFLMPRIGPYDEDVIGPVRFGWIDPACGFELVGEPTCNWGDREVVVTVKATAMLIVRAVDATNGAVVSDVQLACAAHRGDGHPVVVREHASRVEHQPDGSVRLRVALCAHEVQVFPRDPDYAPSFKLTWDARSDGELVVPLARTQSATVRVLTTDGQPVAGAEVWSLQAIEAAAGAPAAAGWREVGMPARPDSELHPSVRWSRQGIDDAPLGTAQTGADGRAQLRVPTNADVVLAAFGPGHVPKAIVGRATTSEIELRVERGTAVRVVLKPKQAVARLVASAAPRRLREARSRDVVYGGIELQIAAATATDPVPSTAVGIPLTADGVCEYRGLPAGKYTIALAGYIESGEFDGISLARVFPAVMLHDGVLNELELNIANLALGRVQGQVLLNGQPCAHVAGTLWSMDWPAHRISVPVVTDAKGRFDVEAPAFSDFRLRGLCTSAGRSVSCKETIHVTAGATTSTVLTARTVTVRTRVVYASGAPAANLEIALDQAGAEDAPDTAVTDDDGRVTLQLDSDAAFRLIVSSPDGPMRPGRRTTSRGDAVLGPFEIPPTGDRAEFHAVLPEGWR